MGWSFGAWDSYSYSFCLPPPQGQRDFHSHDILKCCEMLMETIFTLVTTWTHCRYQTPGTKGVLDQMQVDKYVKSCTQMLNYNTNLIDLTLPTVYIYYIIFSVTQVAALTCWNRLDMTKAQNSVRLDERSSSLRTLPFRQVQDKTDKNVSGSECYQLTSCVNQIHFNLRLLGLWPTFVYERMKERKMDWQNDHLK